MTNTTLSLTDQALDRLTKNLQNSWAGEYALRHQTPVNPRPGDHVEWSIHSTYYAPLFGAKAVLTACGEECSNDSTVRDEIAEMAAMGLYAEATENLFETVQAYRIGSTARRPLNHEQAVQRVNAIAHCHESFIVTQIGRVAYAQIVNATPQYIRESFLDNRLALIADMDQLVNG